MSEKRLHLLHALSALLLGLLVAGTAAAEEETVQKIRIKQSKTGEDGQRQVVIIGENGEGGAHHAFVGNGHHWVSASDGHSFSFATTGHDGKGGFLGISMDEMTPELLEHFGVSAPAGVMVSQLVEDSPAFRAGVEVGDIITAVDEEPVSSARHFAHAIRDREAGETVALTVWRDGSPLHISATLDEREGSWRSAHRFVVRCDEDEDDDCASFATSFAHGGEAFDCGGAEECEVEITCEDGDCSCTMNGEAAECAELGIVGSELDE